MQVALADLVSLAADLVRREDSRPEFLKPLQPDPNVQLHRFLFELAREFKPHISLEIGTCAGAGAAHIATGYPEGTVITIDIDPKAKKAVEGLWIPNVLALVGDSIEVLDRLKWSPSIRMLFIDGDHTYRQAHAEYVGFRSSVVPGGLMLFDDILLNHEMREFWGSVKDPKVELNNLHFSGFGAAIKDPKVRL